MSVVEGTQSEGLFNCYCHNLKKKITWVICCNRLLLSDPVHFILDMPNKLWQMQVIPKLLPPSIHGFLHKNK